MSMFGDVIIIIASLNFLRSIWKTNGCFDEFYFYQLSLGEMSKGSYLSLTLSLIFFLFELDQKD